MPLNPDFRRWDVSVVPGAAVATFGFDVSAVAVLTDPETGAVLYDTAGSPVLLSAWLNSEATSDDLDWIAETLLKLAVLRRAEAARA